ncbi:hypothetical protein ABFS82_01G088900 [Erythranthe guttata]
MMKKTRGLRLGRKLVKVIKWCIHRRTRRRRATVHRQLEPSTPGPISKVRKWVRSLRRGSGFFLCSGKTEPGRYVELGREFPAEQPKLPKGHLAVYVADGDDDTCRVHVPVMYFNHPLFGELLREAEKVYGFDHPGGIQIPCPKSELDSVRMKIAAAGGGGIWRRRRS